MSERSKDEDLLRDDRACCEGFRRGERQAMERVYDYYFGTVRDVCVHGFGGFRGFIEPADTDDAVQRVFAAAFEERARLAYNGVDAYARYLRGICRNTIKDMLKRRARFERQPDVPLGDDPVGAEDALIARETAALLAGFRRALPTDREREILDRYFVDGWSEERLADELGLTRYRVRKTVKTIHRRLEKLLRQHGVGA